MRNKRYFFITTFLCYEPSLFKSKNLSENTFEAIKQKMIAIHECNDIDFVKEAIGLRIMSNTMQFRVLVIPPNWIKIDFYFCVI